MRKISGMNKLNAESISLYVVIFPYMSTFLRETIYPFPNTCAFSRSARTPRTSNDIHHWHMSLWYMTRLSGLQDYAVSIRSILNFAAYLSQINQ